MISNIFSFFAKDPTKKSLEVIFYQGLAFLSTLLTGILFARFFGPEGKGIFDLFVVLCVSIAEISSLGIGSGLLLLQTSGKHVLGKIHGTGTLLSLVIGFFTLSIYLVFSNSINPLFEGLPPDLVLTAFALTSVFVYRQFWVNLTLGLGKVVEQNRFKALLESSGLLIFLFLLFSKPHPSQLFQLIYMYASIQFFVIFLMFVWLLFKDKKLGILNGHFKNLFSYSIIFYIAQVVNVLHFRVDQVMLNLDSGTGSVGIYSVSVRLAEIIFFLETAFVSIYWKRIFDSNHFNLKLFKKTFYRHTIVAVLFSISLGLISPWLIPLLYGNDFSSAVIPMIIILPGLMFWSLSKLCSNYFTFHRKKPQFILIVASIGFFLNLSLNYLFLFIYHWGPTGASLASSISYAIVGISVMIYFFMETKRMAQK